MPTRIKPKNPHKLLKFLAVLTAMAAVATLIIDHIWLGGVVVEERVEFAKSSVQLREYKGTWVEVSNSVLSVRWYASRIWLTGTLAILLVFVWSWLWHGHLPKSVDERTLCHDVSGFVSWIIGKKTKVGPADRRS